jgi:hypothetical protein
MADYDTGIQALDAFIWMWAVSHFLAVACTSEARGRKEHWWPLASGRFIIACGTHSGLSIAHGMPQARKLMRAIRGCGASAGADLAGHFTRDLTALLL